MRRSLFLFISAFFVCACGAGAGTVAPSAQPSATTRIPAPTAAPATALPPTAAPPTSLPPTVIPSPAPSPAPSATPTPAASQPVMQALYTCREGQLCSLGADENAPTVLLQSNEPGMYGFAFTADGAGIVFGREAYPTGELDLLLADRVLQNTRGILTGTGVTSGAGDNAGYGVVGTTADGAQLLFEDQAQLFVANLDGSGRRALMEPRPYGASSTHSYTPAPSGRRVLITSSGNPNSFEVLNIDTGALQLYTLPADQRALALTDDAHILIERFDPPVDLAASNPAGIARFSLGYAVASLEGERVGVAAELRSDDGTVARSPRSAVTGDWLLLSDDDYNDNEAHNGAVLVPVWLLNVRTGERTDFTLPEYDGYGRVALSLVP